MERARIQSCRCGKFLNLRRMLFVFEVINYCLNKNLIINAFPWAFYVNRANGKVSLVFNWHTRCMQFIYLIIDQFGELCRLNSIRKFRAHFNNIRIESSIGNSVVVDAAIFPKVINFLARRGRYLLIIPYIPIAINVLN